MRPSLALLMMLMPGLAAAADLAEAERLLLKGRYGEAAEQLEQLATESPAAAIGHARCLVQTGEREKAQVSLGEAAKRFPQSARLRGELASLALERGDSEAAERHAAEAIALDKDCVPARWATAERLRTSGKLAEAEQAYGWFIGYYNRRPQVDDLWDYRLIGRAVAMHARWTRNSGQFSRLVNDLYPATHRRDADFWPARLEQARLFAEKYNEPAAEEEIARGLAINPHSGELHAAKGSLALDRFDLAAARASAERAIELNDELLEAHCILADVLLADLRPADALSPLAKALELNPHDEPALGRVLAAYIALDGRPGGQLSPRCAELVAAARERNPHCGELFLSAARTFDRMRRYSLAAEYYRSADESMPQLIAVRGELGLVLMRLGQEPEAARLLTEAFAVDPFNVRVKNMLEVLDVLQGYAVLETEHFVLKFDRGQDELLARYAAEHLEQVVFPRVTEQLGYTPQGKTLIEIFSRSESTSGHSWFSARMVGLPFIGTVGACAGRVIALTSPGELAQKFDWAQVLGHEFVHVVNLQQTDFAVPHWLTEGLAVHLEDQPRPRQWLSLLAARSRSKELFTLDSITLGFIRPKSSDDWTLAYCQAELYVEYMLETHGDDAIRKLLAAYGERRSNEGALQHCFGVTQAEFESGYLQFVERQLTSGGLPAEQDEPSLAELEREASAPGSNADAAAKLAAAWLRRDDKPAARRWALVALERQERHPIASYVLARLKLSIGDQSEALMLLEAALDRRQPHADSLALLASLQLQTGNVAAAEELYQLGEKALPHDDRWLKGLARIYLQAQRSEDLAPVLARWSVIEPDNATLHKKRCQLALAQGDIPAAKAAATKALHCNIEDAEAHAFAGAALAASKELAKAAAEYEVAIRLNSERPDWLAALAEIQLAQGRQDDARLVVGRLREQAPNHPKLPVLEKAIQP